MASETKKGILALLAAATFAGLSIAAWIVGTRGWLPSLASTHGAGIDRTLIFLLTATGIMFLLGHFALAWAILRFSGRETISLRLVDAKKEKIIAIVAGLAIVVVAEGGVIAIGHGAWSEFYAQAPPENAWVVEVTGEQFAWNVRYPGPDGAFGHTDPALVDVTNPLGLDPDDPKGRDDVTAVNNIHVPEGRPVFVRLRSKDVIHSFFLPQFRVKQDAVPGMAIDVWFTPTRSGDFEIACTELCGLGHYRMKGLLKILPVEEHAAWWREKTEPATSEPIETNETETAGAEAPSDA